MTSSKVSLLISVLFVLWHLRDVLLYRQQHVNHEACTRSCSGSPIIYVVYDNELSHGIYQVLTPRACKLSINCAPISPGSATYFSYYIPRRTVTTFVRKHKRFKNLCIT